jgi:hypothetical protein
MQINFLRWDEQTGQIKFLVYIPSAHDLEREKPLTFQEIYVDGIVAKVDSISRAYPETYEITLSKTYSEAPAQLTIRVDTDFGAFGEQPFIHNSMGFYETAMPTIAPWRPTPS